MNYIDWLTKQLARYTYKPGYTMTIVRELGSAPFLLVEFVTTDSRQTDKQGRIKFRRMVPYYLGGVGMERQFGDWLQHQLVDLEVHELREWLRLDGEIRDDPHPPPAPATATDPEPVAWRWRSGAQSRHAFTHRADQKSVCGQSGSGWVSGGTLPDCRRCVRKLEREGITS